MRRKWIIGCIGGLVFGLISLIWLLTRTGESPIELGVAISRPEGEHTVLFKASITNKTLHAVKIQGRVQVTYLDQAGAEVAGDFVRLAGSGTDVGGLPPRGFDSVLLEASGSDHIGGVRLRFNYSYDAGPLQRAVSRALNRMRVAAPTGPGKYPLSGYWGWLGRNGFLDGTRKVSYQGTWLGDTKLLQ